jgi:YbbR domain-containing protein
LSRQGHTFSISSKPGKTTAFFVCLLVAAFLWLVKSLNTIYTQNIKIPVEFRNIPQSKKPLQGIPDFLNIEVKASGLKLFLINMSQPFKKMEIDFNSLKTSRKNYVITASSIDLKNSIKFDAQIRQISPDTLYFMENSGFQKTVPVKAAYSIKCARGYGFKAPEINPAFISITGDSASLRRTDTIYTQSIIFNDLAEPVHKTLSLIKPSENIYLNMQKVNVDIKVEKLFEYYVDLPVNAVGVPSLAKSVHVFPARVKIKFTAMENEFNPSDTSNFKAAIDCSRLNGNKARIFLSTQPGNVNILSLEPDEAEVLIIKK